MTPFYCPRCKAACPVDDLHRKTEAHAAVTQCVITFRNPFAGSALGGH